MSFPKRLAAGILLAALISSYAGMTNLWATPRSSMPAQHDIPELQPPRFSPEDRVQAYRENPRYIQYMGKPVFLFGCNQGWTASLQNLDYDFESEFEAIQAAGGNLIRITPFLGPRLDDENRFDPRRYNLPWNRVDGRYRLDLEADGGNPHFWNRLARLVHTAWERGLVISFEYWDLYSTARGPGGNLDFATPPGDRWSAHPFAPGNNHELTGEDALPVKTHMKDIAFCRTVTEGAYPRALELQEQYIRRLLDVLSPYPNVIYCMVNETSAAKAWSDYWLDFTADYFSEYWPEAPFLAGEMPREFNFTENFTIEDMLEDERYGFADMSQYGRGFGLVEVSQMRRNMARFRAFREEDASRLKPLTCMKIYNRADPNVLWIRLLAGCATTRYHRVHNFGQRWQPEMEEVGIQLQAVSAMAAFLKDTDYAPWEMAPDEHIVTHAGVFAEWLALSHPDGARVTALFATDESPAQDAEVRLQLAEGVYGGFWFVPSTGERHEIKPFPAERDRPAGVRVPHGAAFSILHLDRQ